MFGKFDNRRQQYASSQYMSTTMILLAFLFNLYDIIQMVRLLAKRSIFYNSYFPFYRTMNLSKNMPKVM